MADLENGARRQAFPNINIPRLRSSAFSSAIGQSKKTARTRRTQRTYWTHSQRQDTGALMLGFVQLDPETRDTLRKSPDCALCAACPMLDFYQTRFTFAQGR
jgi:hypothetical protein